jgi:hypothetical protein
MICQIRPLETPSPHLQHHVDHRRCKYRPIFPTDVPRLIFKAYLVPGRPSPPRFWRTLTITFHYLPASSTPHSRILQLLTTAGRNIAQIQAIPGLPTMDRCSLRSSFSSPTPATTISAGRASVPQATILPSLPTSVRQYGHLVGGVPPLMAAQPPSRSTRTICTSFRPSMTLPETWRLYSTS